MTTNRITVEVNADVSAYLRQLTRLRRLAARRPHRPLSLLVDGHEYRRRTRSRRGRSRR